VIPPLIYRRFLRISDMSSDCRVTEALAAEASAEWREKKIVWLLAVVTEALPLLNGVFDFLLRTVVYYEILTDIHTTVEDVRSRLTDSTPEHHLNVRLAEWIKGYDLWVSEKAKPGESDPDFVARHERKRVILETDWKVCTDDTVDALREIGYLSDELQSINSEAMPSEEWNKYKHLMDDKKMIIEVIDTDMPTDPYVIDRLRVVASKLEQIVNVIDKRAADINSLLQKYGP